MAQEKKEFICICPDKPGVVDKRIEVRPLHLEGMKPLVEAGEVVLGGAMFDHHPQEGESVPAFSGSMLLVRAENTDAVKQIIKNDIYTRSGVWDEEKVQIIPFKSAVRVGM
ncbi:uncharacterized protein BDW47DRAFT_104008 [Aspergillus candidus]|uniref:YCII-related domain-containing protein n=1 Tax=Aspergillus candidus TaxID=41067 RepID=A0A2I2FED6_ASPCN|nr:hypothetical protein BDW47DRAFT_104008 [Aspergillus candidus]PLB38959.1 hypothetical protein BDW47DRAFT_104008 [Aspergillus candidus]